MIAFCIVQVMTSRPRLDLVINLPALQKLDNMLLVRLARISLSTLFLNH